MVTPLAIATVLSLIGDKVLEAVIGKGAEKATDAVISLLKADKSKIAFKQALGEAIHRYSIDGNRLFIAKPLLESNGPLTNNAVATELAHVLKFNDEPNYDVIGNRWKASFEQPPSWIDFSSEAKLLVKYLRDELLVSEVFGLAIESNNLYAINLNVAIASEVLSNIEVELEELRNMMNSHFGDLAKAIAGASFDINAQIRDFTWYIEEKTVDFIGRNFVYENFMRFMESNSSGYFFVCGDPGIGKTALSAQLVKTQGYIHHFNSRPLGINRSDTFLKNVCAEIIAAYHLDYSFLPPETTQDSGFLIKLMNEVSGKLKGGEKAVIVIDALDEVEDITSISGANLLYLPLILPKGVYIFSTSRKTDLRLRIECEQASVFIDQDSTDNLQDIRAYIEGKANQPGIQSFFLNQKMQQDDFINQLVDKSQGNFMYLRYVLPEIALGAYSNLDIQSLPAGLMSYYEDHWQRMRKQSENDWLEYKLPIVIALSIVKEPVSVDLISDFSQVTNRRRIHSVLHEWQQFLYERKMVVGGSLQPRYRVYHDSFREFIAGKDEVESEHVSLKKAHRIIADTLWNELFEDEAPK
jgi:hypothetical protein